MLSFPAQQSSAPKRSTAEQRPMSGPFSSESRRGNGKRWSSWNDPVGVHGVSPHTSANRPFKEAIPKNRSLTYHYFVGCPGSFIIGPMFILGGILLKSFGTSLGQRPGPFIVDSNRSAFGFGPPARSLCVGWHTWHQLPDGYHGLLRVDEWEEADVRYLRYHKAHTFVGIPQKQVP